MVHTQGPAVSTAGSRGGGTVTGWVGWILFAGIIMFTGGIFNVIEGIIALARDDREREEATKLQAWIRPRLTNR